MQSLQISTIVRNLPFKDMLEFDEEDFLFVFTIQILDCIIYSHQNKQYVYGRNFISITFLGGDGSFSGRSNIGIEFVKIEVYCFQEPIESIV